METKDKNHKFADPSAPRLPTFMDRNRALQSALPALLQQYSVTGDVLDYACGTGRFTRQMSQVSGLSAFGVDSDAKAIESARNFDPDGIYFCADPLDAIPIPDACVDFGFTSCGFSGCSSPSALVNNVKDFVRVIRGGGVAFVVTLSDSFLAGLRQVQGASGKPFCGEKLILSDEGAFRAVYNWSEEDYRIAFSYIGLEVIETRQLYVEDPSARQWWMSLEVPALQCFVLRVGDGGQQRKSH